MTQEQKDTVKALRGQGQAISKIAGALGLSANTIKDFCRREQKKKEFCKHCHKPLAHLPGHKRKTYCDDVCRYAYWKKHRHLMHHKTVYHYICAYCGVAFDSLTRNRKYCGHPCYIAARFGVP